MTDAEFQPILDAVVASTGMQRFREITDPGNPEYRPGARASVLMIHRQQQQAPREPELEPEPTPGARPVPLGAYYLAKGCDYRQLFVMRQPPDPDPVGESRTSPETLKALQTVRSEPTHDAARLIGCACDSRATCLAGKGAVSFSDCLRCAADPALDPLYLAAGVSIPCPANAT